MFKSGTYLSWSHSKDAPSCGVTWLDGWFRASKSGNVTQHCASKHSPYDLQRQAQGPVSSESAWGEYEWWICFAIEVNTLIIFTRTIIIYFLYVHCQGVVVEMMEFAKTRWRGNVVN